MILAHESRQKTEEIIYKHMTDELKCIDDGIREAISSGKMCYSYSGYISETAKKELERCGYEIYTGSQYNEGYVKIQW